MITEYLTDGGASLEADVSSGAFEMPHDLKIICYDDQSHKRLFQDTGLYDRLGYMDDSHFKTSLSYRVAQLQQDG